MDFLEMIRRDGDRFYTAADTADPQRGVPSCGDWTIADLVWHLSEVHWFWATIIEQRVPDENALKALDRLERPDDYQDLVAQGRANLDLLLRALAATDDETSVWTWAPQQNVGFIRRHQVQETAVHRWDLQHAANSAPDPIDPAAASDSIDEFLTIQLPFAVSDAKRLRGTVHVHCTDTEGEWFIHQDGRVEPIHSKGDVAMRGTASDLLLAVYRRVPMTDLDVIGDASIAQQLIDSIDLE
jgi:uncharacterized protein (TIGR03083 family)